MFPNKRWKILYLIKRRRCLIPIVIWLSNERLLVIACGTVNHKGAKWTLIFLVFAAHSFSERGRAKEGRTLGAWMALHSRLLSFFLVPSSMFPHNRPWSIVLYYVQITLGLMMSENSPILHLLDTGKLLLPALQCLLARFKWLQR